MVTALRYIVAQTSKWNTTKRCTPIRHCVSSFSSALPDVTRIVVVGGGIVGTSVAYALAKIIDSENTDQVLLLERSQLTHGATWHAAGLVGQLRGNPGLTRVLQNSVKIIKEVLSISGSDDDWKGVGSLRVASSPERWAEIRRLHSQAKGQGFEMHLVDASEAKRLCPIISTEGVLGAAYVPSDGYVEPYTLTHSMAKAARLSGVVISENTLVQGFKLNERRDTVESVVTSRGIVRCDMVVNAAGLWAQGIGNMLGLSLPCTTVQHQYMVSDPIKDLPANLPTLRDPDARVYYKPEVGGLVMGGWENNTVPCTVPDDFGPELYGGNMDRFEQHIIAAANRVPALESVGIKKLINGPIPVSADGEPILGPAPGMTNVFLACGFTAGIGAGPGAGQAVAEWILHGEPSFDIWGLDARRFGRFQGARDYIRKRTIEVYGDYYNLHPPGKEMTSECRPLRRSPLYDILLVKGMVTGCKFGYDRPNFFSKELDAANTKKARFGWPDWHDEVGDEHRAVRERVAILDQSSFSKLEIVGKSAQSLLSYLSAKDLSASCIGDVHYTQLLNRLGGIEADVTIAHIGVDHFYLVTGSGQSVHDFGYIERYARIRNCLDDVKFINVSSGFAVLNVSGPYSRKLLNTLTDDDVSNSGLPFMTWKRLNIDMAADIRALRVTFVGELGYELHVPTEYAAQVYEALWQAGQQFGVANAGYKAIESLRLEKGYRVWGSDVTPDTNNFEAGLGWNVSLGRGSDFIGEDALAEQKALGPQQRLICLTLERNEPVFGGEAVAIDGNIIGRTTSAGFGYTVGKSIAYAYVPIAVAKRKEGFTVDVMGDLVEAVRESKGLYDASRSRILV